MTRNILIAAGLLFGAMSTQAFADTFATFTNVAAGDSSIVTISGDGGAQTVTVWAGRYSGQLNGQDINDFCVDLNHDISFGTSYTADVSDNISDASGGEITTANGTYFNGGLSSALDSGYYQPVASPVTNQQRADEVAYLIHSYGNASASSFNNGYSLTSNLTAVSLSIWDIETDAGDGLTSGQVVTDSGTASTYGSLVNTFESDAAAHMNDQYLDVKWIQAPIADGGYQSFGYVAAVPESSTITIFAFMLAGGLLCLRTARKKRNA
jgi:hypothetical protein